MECCFDRLEMLDGQFPLATSSLWALGDVGGAVARVDGLKVKREPAGRRIILRRVTHLVTGSNELVHADNILDNVRERPRSEYS